MRTEKVITNLLPKTLTDDELLRFSYRHMDAGGLPNEYQTELLKRFENTIDTLEALENNQ